MKRTASNPKTDWGALQASGVGVGFFQSSESALLSTVGTKVQSHVYNNINTGFGCSALPGRVHWTLSLARLCCPFRCMFGFAAAAV